MPAADIRAAFDEAGAGARFPLGDEVPESVAVFVLEHIEDFPGVVVEPVPVRVYPQGETAAHVIGYIGAPADEDLERAGITVRDRVGRFGIEKEYDSLLRGTSGPDHLPGQRRRGDPRASSTRCRRGPGASAITNIDLALQEFVETALYDGMSLSRRDGKDPVRAAAVVIDPRDGVGPGPGLGAGLRPQPVLHGQHQRRGVGPPAGDGGAEQLRHPGPLPAGVGLQGGALHPGAGEEDLPHGGAGPVRRPARPQRPDLVLRRRRPGVPQHARS